MSRRYTYSRTIRHDGEVETYTAEQFDSFDEAKKVVDKGIHDRKLEISLAKADLRQKTARDGKEQASVTPDSAADDTAALFPEEPKA